MNLDDFSTTVDDMRYINPQVGLDESNAFIENLRTTQGQRTQEIAEDTYNLGTAVPSNLGGLGGAGTYFTSRYQTPQTNEIVANLRSVAQAQALNDAMSNTLAQAKQRYNNAYKAAQRRARARSLSSNPASSASPINPTKLPITTNSNGENEEISSSGSDTVVENTWAGVPYTSSTYKYRKGGLEWFYDASAPYKSLSSPLTAGKDGATRKISGKTYIAMNGQWYPVVKSPF